MCAYAAVPNADGCFSTQARTASGGGARCKVAVIALKHVVTTLVFGSACATSALALPQITVDIANPGPPLDPAAASTPWDRSATATLSWDLQGGRAMREPTIVHVATDGRYLLLRFDVTQREPIIQTQRTNDVGQGTDDDVWIDVWPSGPTGFQYQFVATPNGTHYQSSTENTTFAPRWESFGAVRAGGYTVTMKIPLDVMRGAQSTAWRVQFARYIRATGQQAVWSFDAAQISPDDPARAGTMSIATPKARRPQPRLAAYTLATAASNAAGGTRAKAGLDLSIPVSESTSVYATFYPDNSNVELDQQTISPTVYPRAFIEVRPFFTQGANNFNQFYCNFCNALTPLYTPAIPTPRTGYAVEGKSGPFSFTAFDAAGEGQRQDTAAGLIYTSPDTRWNASLNHVAVNLPGFTDNETVTGLFYNDLKHVVLYANYGTDSGTNVVDGNRAQYYDAGATWSSQTFSIWGGVHRIGQDFNPADGFILKPGVNGWGLFANRIWTFAPQVRLAAVSLGGSVTRNHGDDGPLDQTNNKLNLDLLTRNAIDVNVSSGSSYLRLPDGVFTPVSQNGVSVTVHSGSQTNNPISFDAHGPSANPTQISYNTGTFGGGRLDTWIRSSTVRIGSRGTLTMQLDDTAQRFTAGTANVQWFESVAYAYQIGRDSSLGIGVRRVVGFPPVPNGGGNCAGTCANISVAFHSRLSHSEVYVAYGDPNALTTVPQALFKWIFYAGSDKGT